jgi:hypothetical protein
VGGLKNPLGGRHNPLPPFGIINNCELQICFNINTEITNNLCFGHGFHCEVANNIVMNVHWQYIPSLDSGISRFKNNSLHGLKVGLYFREKRILNDVTGSCTLWRQPYSAFNG